MAPYKHIVSSPIFSTRATRAEQRLKQLLNSMYNKDWYTSYKIVLEEFLDMHELFETCDNNFNYIQNDKSQYTIKYIETFCKKYADGPIMTIDAGPNVHLLFREDQIDILPLWYLLLNQL